MFTKKDFDEILQYLKAIEAATGRGGVHIEVDKGIITNIKYTVSSRRENPKK